jgi:uracil-DNA glycosylase family 4
MMAGYVESLRSPFFIMTTKTAFDPACRQCTRLAKFLDAVRVEEPDYFCRPVPQFGDPRAQLLLVGLAPGMHGANRTGRPFTGDFAGILLYETLFKFGFASAPISTAANDGLTLKGCRITNAVKCLPPANKPLPDEIRRCNDYLQVELEQSEDVKVILALGAIAHGAVLKALSLPARSAGFGHGAEHVLPGGRIMIDSYHCSRYNTQTRRLTPAMFETVMARARQMLTP